MVIAPQHNQVCALLPSSKHCRDRKIKKKMGVLRYYLCMHQRKDYYKLFPIEDTNEVKALSEAELAALRAKAREMERKLQELAILNPETDEWKGYKAQEESRAESRRLSKKVRVAASQPERDARMVARRRRWQRR